ncbi:MAG: hypothetical protein QXD03_02050 [Candidatus Anstonellales archaeon]
MLIKKSEIEVLKDLSEIIIKEFDSDSDLMRRNIYRDKNIPNPYFMMMACIVEERYDIFMNIYGMLKDRISNRDILNIMTSIHHKSMYSIIKMIVRDRPEMFKFIFSIIFSISKYSEYLSFYMDIIDSLVIRDRKVSDIIKGFVYIFRKSPKSVTYNLGEARIAFKHVVCDLIDFIDNRAIRIMYDNYRIMDIAHAIAYIRVMK